MEAPVGSIVGRLVLDISEWQRALAQAQQQLAQFQQAMTQATAGQSSQASSTQQLAAAYLAMSQAIGQQAQAYTQAQAATLQYRREQDSAREALRQQRTEQQQTAQGAREAGRQMAEAAREAQRQVAEAAREAARAQREAQAQTVQEAREAQRQMAEAAREAQRQATESLRAAYREQQAVQEQAGRAAEEALRREDAAAQAARRQRREEARQAAQDAVQTVPRQAPASQLPFTAIQNATEQFSRAMQQAGNSQDRMRQAILQGQQALAQFNVTIDASGRMTDRFGQVLSSGSADALRQFRTGIREAQAELNTFKQFGIDARSGGGGGDFLSRMLPIAGALGFVNTLTAVVSALKNFAAESVQIAGRMEDLARSFVALEGSAAGAQRTLGMAFSVAQRAGVDFETVAKGLRNLEAGARGTVLTSEQIQRAFEGITLGARALGATTDQTGRALVAWEQILTKGRLSAEELVRQLGNAIPGGLAIAAQAFGVTTARFREMAESGITPVTAALIGFGEAMRGIGESAGPIEGITATFARLHNETQAWMNAFGQGIKDVLPLLNELVRLSEDVRKTLGIGSPGQGPQAPQAAQTWVGQISQFLRDAIQQGVKPLGVSVVPGAQTPAAAPTAATTFPVAESRYTEQILRAAQARQIDPGLLSQLIRAESGFRPFAVSEAGTIGLGQIKPTTARELQPGITREELFEPQRNIDLAAQYLAKQLEAFKETGDQVRLALTAYHSGASKVQELLRTAVARNLPPTLEGVLQIPQAAGGLGPAGRAYAGRVLEAPNVRQLTPEQLGQARTRMAEGWSQDIAEAMDRFAGLKRQVEDAAASGRNFGGMLNKDIRQEADRVLKIFTDILGAMARFPELAAQIPPELRQIVELNAKQAGIWREGIMSEERRLELLRQEVETLEQVAIQQEATRLAQEQGQTDAERYRRQATADLQRQRLEDRPRQAGLTLQQQLAEYEQRAQALRTQVDQTALQLDRMQAQQMLPGIQAQMGRIQTQLGRPEVSAPEQARLTVAEQGAEAKRQLMTILQTIQQNPAIAQIAPQILAQWEAAFQQLPKFIDEQGQKAYDAVVRQTRDTFRGLTDQFDQITMQLGAAGLDPLAADLARIDKSFAGLLDRVQNLDAALEKLSVGATVDQQGAIQALRDRLALITEARVEEGRLAAEVERRDRDLLGMREQVTRTREGIVDPQQRESTRMRQRLERGGFTEAGEREARGLVREQEALERVIMAVELWRDLSQGVGSAWVQALSSIADGTQTVSQAFTAMGKSIMKTMADIAAQQAFQAIFRLGVGLLTGALAPSAGTGLYSPGLGAESPVAVGAGINPVLFQHGGVVTRPTLAILGEAGTEYVIPRAQMQSMQAAMRVGTARDEESADGGRGAVPFQHGEVVDRPTRTMTGEVGTEHLMPQAQMQAMQSMQTAIRADTPRGEGIASSATAAVPSFHHDRAMNRPTRAMGGEAGTEHAMPHAQTQSMQIAIPFQHGGVVNRPTLGMVGENPAMNPEIIFNKPQWQQLSSMIRPQGGQERAVSIHNYPSKAAAEEGAARDRAQGGRAIINEVLSDLSQGEGSKINRAMRMMQR